MAIEILRTYEVAVWGNIHSLVVLVFRYAHSMYIQNIFILIEKYSYNSPIEPVFSRFTDLKVLIASTCLHDF